MRRERKLHRLEPLTARVALLFAIGVLGCKPSVATEATKTNDAEPTATALAKDRDAIYDDPAAALRAVLERKPRVLAIGEAHAQKTQGGIPSTAKRFTEQMLPELRGKASDLILELMAPPSGCEAKTEAVRKEMKTVTAPQAETNQNEYVVMGEAAQKLGIEPHLLHPTCEDWKPLTAPGADPTEGSLRLIARLLREMGERALARNEREGKLDRIVVVYGGAMHNDLAPGPGAADFAYGPALAERAKGRYVELDIFEPEAVRDAGPWPKLPWYPRFDRAAHPDKTTLFAPKAVDALSFTMILPASAARPATPVP